MTTPEFSANAHSLARLLKVIADPDRLRVLGLLASQPRSDSELSAEITLPLAIISHHLRKLIESEFITASGDPAARKYTLNTEQLLLLRRAPLDDAAPEGVSSGSNSDDDSARQKVIRNFFEGDRLKSIPARQQQKLIVLEHLVTRFDPEMEYPERSVNDILSQSHEDFASLRRYLVDFGLMTRDHGVYRRVDAPPNLTN